MKNVLLIVMSMTKLLINVIIYFILFIFCGKENFITQKGNNNNTVQAASTKMRLAKLGGLNPRSKEPKNKYKKKIYQGPLSQSMNNMVSFSIYPVEGNL